MSEHRVAWSESGLEAHPRAVRRSKHAATLAEEKDGGEGIQL